MQKQRYDVRGQTIELEERDGVVAVKVAEQRSAERDPEELAEELDLGSIARELHGDRTASRFSDAGWLFVHPSNRVRSAVDANDPPDGTQAVGRVFTDEEGNTRIDTHRLTVKLSPDLSEERAEKTLRELGVQVVKQLEFAENLYEVAVPETESTFSFIEETEQHRSVEYAEPKLVEYMEVRSSMAEARAGYRPNDPEYDRQWQWGPIDAERAWQETRGGDVTVGVIDTGFDVDHEDLAGALSDATGHYRSTGVASEEFVVGTTNYPTSDHGTFCAGMAAAVGDNGRGGCGAAWEADLLPVACLPDQVGSQTTLALAVSYAADPTTESRAVDAGLTASDGADVISCSLGPSNGASWIMHSVLKDAIDFAVENGRDGKGTPVFWAVSNGNVTIDGEDGTDQVSAYQNTIAVGRSTSEDTEHGSAYGPKLDFLAPGVDVYSTGSNDTYRTSTGTSFAAPCAAGVAGLVLDVAPSLGWEDALWSMIDTCEKVGDVTYGDDGHHDRYGFGRINAAEAVASAMSKSSVGEPTIDGPEAVGPDDAPPTFTVDTAGNSHYLVELATRAELFDWAGHGAERTTANFYPIYGEDDVSRHTESTYMPSADVWDRLLNGNPSQVYYRVHTANGETGWDGWQVSTPDGNYASAPSVAVEAARSDQSTPSIEAPGTVGATGEPPTFQVDSGSNSHYVVELATRAELFDAAAHGDERTAENFYPRYDQDVERHTASTFAPPADAWNRLLASSPEKVYYRVHTADGATGWDNWQVSTPDGAVDQAPAMRIAGGQLIEASVGDGGRNRPEDVYALKERLAELGFDWITLNPAVTDDLVDVIKLVQSITDGRDTVHGDGLVEPSGPMHSWLTALNPPRWQRMPAGSPEGSAGFYNVEVAEQPRDDHEYGTNWLANTIEDAAGAYQENYRRDAANAAPITVNDASLPAGGPTPDHSGHETGLVCDLRLPTTDGTAPGGTTVRDDDYDRDAMRAMLEAVTDQELHDRVFLNDPELVADGLCMELSGHDDHAHVEISPPEREDAAREVVAESEAAEAGEQTPERRIQR